MEDGIDDGAELTLWGDAWRDDTDGDGLINLLDRDADGDGLADAEDSDPGTHTTPTDDLTAPRPHPTHHCCGAGHVRIANPTAPHRRSTAISIPIGAAEGDGQWIQYDIGEVAMISEVDIAWAQGDHDKSSFTLEISSDGTSWTEVFSGDSSGTTRDFETYTFPAVAARYVLIAGYGNASDLWNEIAETEIYGEPINLGRHCNENHWQKKPTPPS